MNILLTHVYSKHNNGDAAIVSAQISELGRVFPGCHLDILTIDTVRPRATFDGVPLHNALMYGAVSPNRNRALKLLFAVTMVTYTSLWALVFRKFRLQLPLPQSWQKSTALLAQADMQVCVGGGYLRAKDDYTSTILLGLLVHQIWIAKLLGKPVYLYAQSFGPYPRRIQYKLARFGLAQADLILVREAKSWQLLKRMGLAGERVVQVPDSAFLFQPKISGNARQPLGLMRHELVVGVTVRAWLKPKAQTSYEQAMAEFIDRLQDLGLKVVVIPQVTSARQHDDDRIVGRRIKRLLRRTDNVAVLTQRFTHYEIKSVFACLDYLVGTRFHSVIFGLSNYVPAIAVEYEHKTSGIMQDLGLEQWVIPIEDVTADKLYAMFQRLEKDREKYKTHLQDVIPNYIAKAASAAELIQQAWEHSHAGGA